MGEGIDDPLWSITTVYRFSCSSIHTYHHRCLNTKEPPLLLRMFPSFYFTYMYKQCCLFLAPFPIDYPGYRLVSSRLIKFTYNPTHNKPNGFQHHLFCGKRGRQGQSPLRVIGANNTVTGEPPPPHGGVCYMVFSWNFPKWVMKNVSLLFLDIINPDCSYPPPTKYHIPA